MPPIFSKETSAVWMQNHSREGQKRTSPCERDCPAGNPIQQMELALAEGKPGLALRRLRARNPFPGVTGRVCPHPCEQACNRRHYDEAVSVRGLERFAADHGSSAEAAFRPLPPSGKSLAVIGSGPAGLSCAWFAALLGHAVTVFEAAPLAGGVPRQSIPDFRLPKGVVDKEVGLILDLGVEILTSTAVGRDVSLEAVLERFDACLVAVGNGRERRLNVPGMNRARPAVEFLRAANLNRQRLDGQKVAVVGGGGVAFDCAFTAARLGAAEVHLVFPEAAEQMRVPPEEVEQAVQEGLRLHHGCLAAEVCGGAGAPGALKARRLKSFSFDESGRLHAEYQDAPPLELPADLVICASGLLADLDFLSGLNLETTPRGLLAVDPVTRMTSRPGLFAAGECASGPGLVAQAVAEGRRAAFAAHAWLHGLDPDAPLDAFIDEDGNPVLQAAATLAEPHVVDFGEIVNLGYNPRAPRRRTAGVTAKGTWLPFEELDKGFGPEAAQAEAERCLHCGHCRECGQCVECCPGLILEKGDRGPRVAYPEECWHCGCCRLACPGACIEFKFPLRTLL